MTPKLKNAVNGRQTKHLNDRCNVVCARSDKWPGMQKRMKGEQMTINKNNELKEDQKKAMEAIMSGKNVFVTGGAGTGKSHLVKRVVEELSDAGKNVMVCAPTSGAALLIDGVTIHSGFGYAFGPALTGANKLAIRTRDTIKNADVIIIDEVSMVRCDLMDSIAASISTAAKYSRRPKQIIVFGDFAQLPPVIKNDGTREVLEKYYRRDIGCGFAFLGDAWDRMHFETVCLTEVIRQADTEFAAKLNMIRTGNPDALDFINNNASYVPDPGSVTLFATNPEANALNRKKLDDLKGSIIKFNPITEGAVSNEQDNETISLKTGARIIITSNYNQDFAEQIAGVVKSGNFANGTQATVINAVHDPLNPIKDCIIAELDDGRKYKINRQRNDICGYRIDEYGDLQRIVEGSIYQIPIKLGYGITVHRSQGATFDSVNLDPSFKYKNSGQIYVALSRIRSLSGLNLIREISKSNLYVDPAVRKLYSF